jgi:hypothetical protein
MNKKKLFLSIATATLLLSGCDNGSDDKGEVSQDEVVTSSIIDTESAKINALNDKYVINSEVRELNSYSIIYAEVKPEFNYSPEFGVILKNPISGGSREVKSLNFLPDNLDFQNITINDFVEKAELILYEFNQANNSFEEKKRLSFVLENSSLLLSGSFPIDSINVYKTEIVLKPTEFVTYRGISDPALFDFNDRGQITNIESFFNLELQHESNGKDIFGVTVTGGSEEDSGYITKKFELSKNGEFNLSDEAYYTMFIKVDYNQTEDKIEVAKKYIESITNYNQLLSEGVEIKREEDLKQTLTVDREFAPLLEDSFDLKLEIYLSSNDFINYKTGESYLVPLYTLHDISIDSSGQAISIGTNVAPVLFQMTMHQSDLSSFNSDINLSKQFKLELRATDDNEDDPASSLQYRCDISNSYNDTINQISGSDWSSSNECEFEFIDDESRIKPFQIKGYVRDDDGYIGERVFVR